MTLIDFATLSICLMCWVVIATNIGLHWHLWRPMLAFCITMLVTCLAAYVLIMTLIDWLYRPTHYPAQGPLTFGSDGNAK